LFALFAVLCYNITSYVQGEVLRMIGLIGAMALEVDEIRSLLHERKKISVGCTDFYEGKLHGKSVVIATCGIGKVNAALCAQAMLLHFQPRLIINIGVGGGLLGGMRIGDIAIASSVVQHDMDTTPLGEPRGFISNLQLVQMQCSGQAVQALAAAAKTLENVQVHIGVIATGDCFVNKQGMKDELVRHFDAIACEMEGAAIGQVCALHNVPFCVIRAISDGADDDSPKDFATFAKQAAEQSAALLLNAFQNDDMVTL